MPSFRASAFGGPARRAGFAGWELWDRHAIQADEDERERLAAPGEDGLPVLVWNGYRNHEEPGSWSETSAVATRLGVRAFKFNYPSPGEAGSAGDTRARAAEWASSLPPGVAPLCECHGGTVAETPEAAADLLAALPRGDWGVIVHALAGARDDLRRWVDVFGPRVVHLHLAARDARGRWKPLRAVVDELRHRLAILRSGGFEGSASLEFTVGTGRPGERPEGQLAEAFADLVALAPAWKECFS